MVLEYIGDMLGSITIIAGGLLFSIIAIILGLTRAITKETSVWAILFASLSWLFALILP